MKRIAVFCIPAHGHTNPMLPVAAELARRGDAVRFYSFAPFEEKIRATGAEYISCDAYLAALTERDWALCAESCANCRASGGCLAGIVVPPDHRLNARPCSPAECPRFAAKEGGAA